MFRHDDQVNHATDHGHSTSIREPSRAKQDMSSKIYAKQVLLCHVHHVHVMSCHAKHVRKIATHTHTQFLAKNITIPNTKQAMRWTVIIKKKTDHE